jgi:alkylation response protein AidB-like acyl-CoA dehydrogenase
LGWRASDTAEIAFDNVEIPAENLMGEGRRFSLYYAALLWKG